MQMFRLLGVIFLCVGLFGCVAKPAAPCPASSAVTLHTAWSRGGVVSTNKQYLRFTPAYQNGVLYTANASGQLHAIDARSGRTLWSASTRAPVLTAPVVSGHQLLVGTSLGDLIAFSTSNGSPLWFQAYQSALLAPPLVSQGVVVAQSLDGEVAAYRQNNGHLLWNMQFVSPDLALRLSGQPALAGSRVMVPLANGQLISVGLRSGLPNWRIILANPAGNTTIERMVDLVSHPVVRGNTAYVAGYQGNLSAVAINNGKVRWRHRLSSFTNIAQSGRSVYATDGQGVLWSFDAATGRVQWRQSLLRGRWAGSPAVQANVIWVGDDHGYLYGFSAQDGHLLTLTQASRTAIVAAPLVVNQRLFVASVGGRLTALDVNQISA